MTGMRLARTMLCLTLLAGRLGLAVVGGRAMATLSIAGRPAGAQLADLFSNGGHGIYTLALGTPLTNTAARLHVQVADNQGNITRVARTFRVAGPPPVLVPRVYMPTVGN